MITKFSFGICIGIFLYYLIIKGYLGYKIKNLFLFYKNSNNLNTFIFYFIIFTWLLFFIFFSIESYLFEYFNINEIYCNEEDSN